MADDSTVTTGPLQGVRVLEIGHALAGPFACTLLGDFGAEIIKLESPGRGDSHRGDSQRTMGPKVDGKALWWQVTGRNKKSLAVDLKAPEGLEVARRLVASADVVVENFRPGVIGRLGLDYDECAALNPKLVMLHVSGFGQDGPYRERGGFGKISEAFSGATFLTGDPDRAPLHPGYSLGDLVTGLMGAYGVMLALYQREQDGHGQEIDLALYEALFRMIEWQVPIFEATGHAVTRDGPRFPFDAGYLMDICADAEGESVVVSAATGPMITRLKEVLTSSGYLDGDVEEPAEVKAGLKSWLKARTANEAMEDLLAKNLVAGKVNGPRQLMEDPHIAARGNIVQVACPGIGDVSMPGVLPRLGRTPGAIRFSAPDHGAHSREILALAGYDKAQIDELVKTGVVEE
jgi:crotonobetainyl-CoA:carnitine CoA-transferase CaiB-like acyl-CoA transferase